MTNSKKKILIILTYVSFFITIPIIKNESRLIEKKIRSYKSEIFILEKSILEASLEFHYLSSSGVLTDNIKEYIGSKYNNLDLTQIFSSLEEFIFEQKKITKVLINER